MGDNLKVVWAKSPTLSLAVEIHGNKSSWHTSSYC